MKPENNHPNRKENPVVISITSIEISLEEYNKLIENEGKIRISLTIKRNIDGNTYLCFGDKEGKSTVSTKGLYFETTYTKVTTEEEINESREKLMERFEQEQQEKCRKCREEK
jgi:hypothetical protein